jgi:hypothetical protein
MYVCFRDRDRHKLRVTSRQILGDGSNDEGDSMRAGLQGQLPPNSHFQYLLKKLLDRFIHPPIDLSIILVFYQKTINNLI